MLILGAKGFAKEVLEVLHQRNELENVYFYDDVTPDLPAQLFGRFGIIRTPDEAAALFSRDKRFVLGTGSPKLRRMLAEKMQQAGGELTSVISPRASVGAFGISIGAGTCLMTGTVLTSDIVVEQGTLINLNCTIGHDVRLGEFSELSPGVHVSGHVTLGRNVTIGTGAVLLPGVTIGDNSIIGAGSVVNKSVEANVVAVGIPAKVIKQL